MQTYIRIPYTIGLAILMATGCAGAVDRNTQLRQAAWNGNISQAQDAINNGANVNAKDTIGETPLHWATKMTHTTVAQLLVDNGSDVNAKSNFDVTPLHWAAARGNTDTAQILINNGAKVNAQNKENTSPLHWAAGNTDTDRAELFIKNGADVNARDLLGNTPADIAQNLGNTYIETLCNDISSLQHGNIDQVITQDTSPEYKQFYAEAMIAYGYPDIAQRIIDQYMDQLSDEAYADIILHAARHRNAFDQGAFAAFMSYMRNTYEDDNKAQAVADTAWNNTKSGNVSADVVTWVLNNYENQCRQFCDNNGNTILHIAAANKQYNVLLPRITTVVMQNQSHNPYNKDEKKPVMIARENGNHEGAAIIKNAAWLQSELSPDNYKSYVEFPSEISEHIISYIRGNELPQYTTTQQ